MIKHNASPEHGKQSQQTKHQNSRPALVVDFSAISDRIGARVQNTLSSAAEASEKIGGIQARTALAVMEKSLHLHTTATQCGSAVYEHTAPILAANIAKYNAEKGMSNGELAQIAIDITGQLKAYFSNLAKIAAETPALYAPVYTGLAETATAVSAYFAKVVSQNQKVN